MFFNNIVGAIALLIVIYIIWQIKIIILLAFSAIFLATAINYLVKILMRTGMKKRGVAIFFALLFLFLILASFIILIIPPFIDQVQQSLHLLPLVVDKIEVWLRWLEQIVPDRLVGEIQKLENLTSNIPSLVTQFISNFYEIFSGSLGVLLNVLLVIVVMIMLLTSPRSYVRLFLVFFPAFYRRRAAYILKKCEIAW